MANNTGTFFNVNDNDGIPLVGVSTDGKVMINHLYGNCLIGSTSVTGTASQPLQVTGGAHVSGNLGIGTTNPTVKLDIIGNAKVLGIITASSFVGNLTGTATTANNVSSTININTTGIITASTLNIGTGGTVFTTTSIGNIGIGTTNPEAKLHVVGGAYVSDNLGIGTTNPTVKLDIIGNVKVLGIITASSFVGNLTGTATTALGFSTTSSINTTGIITANTFVGNLTGTATTALGFFATSSINTTGIITASSFVGGLTGIASTATTALGFSTTASINTTGIITASTLNIGTGGTVFTTTSIGNIGIGTTNPTVKLQVQGDANISGILTASKVASGIISNSKVSAYILQKSDVGKYISISSGGVTVPSGIFSEGDVISIYNNSVSNQTITQGTSVTMYFSGTSTTGNRTLSQRGLSTILCVGTNTFIIGGAGLS